MMAFDSNLAPIVGQQTTLTGAAGADIGARIDLLEVRAVAGECDLVVHGVVFGLPVGFLFSPATGQFIPDRTHGRVLSDGGVRALAAHGALTFTAVPLGSGRRIGIDRDLDGVLDGDQRGRQ